MAFPRQEYRSRLPFPSPGALPYPGIQPESLALAGGFFTAEPPGKPHAPKSPNFRGKANKVRADLQLIYSKRGGITHLLLEVFQKCHSIWQVWLQHLLWKGESRKVISFLRIIRWKVWGGKVPSLLQTAQTSCLPTPMPMQPPLTAGQPLSYWKGALTPVPSPYYGCGWEDASVELFLSPSFPRANNLPPGTEEKGNVHNIKPRKQHTKLTGAAIFTKPAPSGTVLPESGSCHDRLERSPPLANLNQYEERLSHFRFRTGCTGGGPDPANGIEEPAKLVRLRRSFTNINMLLERAIWLVDSVEWVELSQ